MPSVTYKPAATFPTSTASPSSFFTFTGVTQSATKVVRESLTENDRLFDIWMYHRYGHNHVSHSLLTRYALGAPASALEKDWNGGERHNGLVSLDPSTRPADPDLPPASQSQETPPPELPPPITVDNWSSPEFLGHKISYPRYLEFFHAEIGRLGTRATVAKYLFSPLANDANSDGDGDGKPNWPGPLMLSRLCHGAFHPMIHIGLGLEFDDRVVLAEGLAATAGHPLEYQFSWATSVPSAHSASTGDESATDPNARPGPGPGPTLLDLYHTMTTSGPALDPATFARMEFTKIMRTFDSDPAAKELQTLLAHWPLEGLEDDDVAASRVEEVAWLATLLLGGTGHTPPSTSIRKTPLDFFLMHVVTSSIFVQLFVKTFKEPTDRRAVLSTYATAVFYTALIVGSPAIDAARPMGYSLSRGSDVAGNGDGVGVGDENTNVNGNNNEHTNGHTNGHANGTGTANAPKGSKQTNTASLEDNPWLSIVSNSLVIPDSHVPKTIRALLYFSQEYGNAGTDNVAARSTLPGARGVDGSLFARVAGRVMDVAGWVREGQISGTWVRGIGWERGRL